MKNKKQEFEINGCTVLFCLYLLLFALFVAYDDYNVKIDPYCRGVEAKYQKLIQSEGPDADVVTTQGAD